MSKKKVSEKTQETPAVSCSDLPALPVDNRPPEEQLAECEELIHKKTDDFIDVVINLRKIKDGKLFECRKDEKGNPLYQGFGDYMDKEFGFRRAYYSRLNKAYTTYELVTKGMNEEHKKEFPVYPALYVALSDVKKDQRLKALEAVQDKAKKTNQRITGTDVINWGKKNKAIKEKAKYEEGPVKQVSIFAGLVNKIVDNNTFRANNEIKLKDKETLIKNLQKILESLQKM